MALTAAIIPQASAQSSPAVTVVADATDGTAQLRAKLADTEARLRSITEDNRRLNNEVKAATVAMGNLRRELEAMRGQAAGAASGRTEEADRKRITESEATLAAVRAAADRADLQARSQIDEARRTIEELRKRLDEAAAEPARLRAQLAATEQALAVLRTQAAAEKKRAESR